MSKSGSALGAASCKDLSAVGSAHSLAETGFLASLSLLGLVSSKHFFHLRHKASQSFG